MVSVFLQSISPKSFSLSVGLHGVESYPGSGFGLAIVQRSISRLGGTSGIESSGQEGSRFWIKLPAYLPR